MEKIQETKNHFLEQLELLGLDIGTKLDQLEKEKQDYALFQRIHEQLESSRIEFCLSYFSLSSEDKKALEKKLLELFKDQEIVDNILQEIINLYYLNEEDMLELNETSSQKEIALENLKTLATKIEKYLAEVNMEEVTEEEKRLSDKLDRIVSIGSILEGEDSSAIEDIDFLEEALESVALPNEEKRDILVYLIQHNLQVYRSPKTEKQEELEAIEEGFTITPELREQIEDLLNNSAIRERIVRVVNDDLTETIRITGGTKEEQQQVEDSLFLATDEMEHTMQENHELTPEEALEAFFQKYDDLTRKKRRLLELLLTEEEIVDYTEEEKDRILEEADLFQEENQSSIASLTYEDKERINQFMTALYQNPDNRKAIYETRIFEGKEEVDGDAAYEIQIMRNLLDATTEEDRELRLKALHRLQTILTTAKEAVRTNDNPVIEKEEGHLFYIMTDEEKSTLEEDIALESDKKGIPPTYYNEIKNQLQAIKNRGERTLVSTQPINPGFKAMKKEGVRCTKGVRTKVFYIPVGKTDSIILGTSFITGKDNMKEQELKVKKYFQQIEELKERLKEESTYRTETEESDFTTKKILSLLGKKELEDMLEDNPQPEDEIEYQK